MRINKYKTELSKEKIPYLIKERAFNYECDNLMSPNKIFTMLNKVFKHGYQSDEYVYLLAFNTNRLQGIFELSHGDIDNSILPIKSIITKLLLCGSGNCVIAHNHPGGSLIPSKEDVKVYDKIKKGLEMVEIKLLDFMIVTDECYFSFAEKGM